MIKLQMGIIVSGKGVNSDLSAITTLIKNAIPESGAKIEVTVTELHGKEPRTFMERLVDRVFRP